MRVLLVEPDRLLARLYVKALKLAGHEVSTAVSAQSAVHAADENTPDVVIMELQLPLHNGIEFLYEFRSYSEWLHVPVIIQSYVPPHEYVKAVTLRRELGVTECLHKPATTLKELVAVVGQQTSLLAP